MQVEQIYHAIEIFSQEIDRWEKRPHKHNFFELVYVEYGEGEQCINDYTFTYQKDNIFLLPPLDCHTFRIHHKTKFIFVRFTNTLFTKRSADYADYSNWFDKLTYILINYNRIPGDIIQNSLDKPYLISSIKALHQEYIHRDKYSHSIIQSAMVSLLNILTRNIEKALLNKLPVQDNKFGEITNYIQHNLCNKHKLTLHALANHFHISPTYFGEYFRKHAGESLQDYILKSKLKLAEAKLLHSDLSLKEIAYQMSFTDSSHLSRLFKKYYKRNVSEFRQEGKLSLQLH